MNGCHVASGARFEVAGTSRDRVTIDLRGIGDAVRAAAAVRGMGVAQLVRRALVMSLDLRATATVASVKGGSDGQTPARETAKLTLRLTRAHADALMLNAGALGLSYGDYVGRLVANSSLPQPVAERQADRAALLASNDRMAALSTDLAAHRDHATGLLRGRLVYVAKQCRGERHCQPTAGNTLASIHRPTS